MPKNPNVNTGPSHWVGREAIQGGWTSGRQSKHVFGIRRVAGPDREEIVQVVEERVDPIVGYHNPVHGGGDGVEDVGSGT